MCTMLLTAACGAPSDGAVDAIDDDDVPFGLLEEDRSSADAAAPSGELVEIYLVVGADDLLFPTVRSLDDTSAGEVIAELEQDLSDVEVAAGLRNPLADRDVIAGVTLEDGLATIDLTSEFTQMSAANQLLGVAQIVFTAARRPGIDRVAFTLDGQPIQVPMGDGTLTAQPVSPGDYRRFTIN